MNKLIKNDYLIAILAALSYTVFAFELVNYSVIVGVLALSIIYFFPIKILLIPQNERKTIDLLSALVIGAILIFALITPLFESNLSLQILGLALILINLFFVFKQYKHTNSNFISHLICKWILAIAIFGF